MAQVGPYLEVNRPEQDFSLGECIRDFSFIDGSHEIDAMTRAEKIGHYGAVWAIKLGASVVSASRGDLAASRAETIEAWNFGASHDVGWNFATGIQRGHFALWSGELAEAESWYSKELKVEGNSYLSGLSEACLFAALAESGDVCSPGRLSVHGER